MRHQAFFSVVTRPALWRPAMTPASSRTVPRGGELGRRLLARGHRLLMRAALGVALVLLVVAGGLLLLRSAHAGRVYPAIYVADEALGGLTHDEARAVLRQRAEAVEKSSVAFNYGDQQWRTSWRDVGVTVEADDSLAAAYAVGREEDALTRLRSTFGLVRADERIPLAIRLDHEVLGRWFDTIDRDLGMPPREAALAIAGTSVTIVPEADGTVVDRDRATSELIAALRGLRPVEGPLPTVAKPAVVRAGDLNAARERLAQALSQSVQVTLGGAYWTLPPGELGRFVSQRVDPTKRGAEAFSLSLDRSGLAAWLEERLAPQINREPEDAVVGWNGERVVSVEESVDGVVLKPEPLAELVEQSFFGDHKPAPAPVTVTKPMIDSGNLDGLGVVTLLGTGTSNYSGSSDGRATNVEVGAQLLNGTLVPPRGEFSFNGAIGVINEENGFVEAQVIDGERIGKDIGGGICQVSTTVFRAAFLAGMPITEWWPHRYRIPFYEYDGWPPGLDASILQPSEDPSTWGDFRFENPSDHWLLIESWTNGVQVVVNIYGADLGYRVETDGPRYGAKYQILPDEEVVDPELEPGTISWTELAEEGQEVGHYRWVYDRNGNLLWERNFYTKYYPRGNVWRVSPDMAGDSPADPDRPLPPVVDPAVEDTPAFQEAPAEDAAAESDEA